MIAAHGGKLTDRVLTGKALEDATKQAKSLPTVTVDYDTARDVQNLARGVFSPLQGFVGKADFDSICQRNCLVNGGTGATGMLSNKLNCFCMKIP